MGYTLVSTALGKTFDNIISQSYLFVSGKPLSFLLKFDSHRDAKIFFVCLLVDN